MFQWLREYMELRAEFRERNSVCQSCEAFKQMNDHLRMDNEKLLRRVLEHKPELERAVPEPNTAPLPNRFTSWRVRQQMLEAEDRAKAKSLKNAAQPDASVEKLEQELDIAAADREKQSGTPRVNG